jgi:DNA-binding XRE family transcriptional regulator
LRFFCLLNFFLTSRYETTLGVGLLKCRGKKGGLGMVTATTIKVVRAYLGISQGELAERMIVSISLISAVEKGTKRITPEFAKRFKRAVGITEATLIDIHYMKSILTE